MGKKKHKGKREKKTGSTATATNSVAAETISLLEQSQISPHYKASADQRRRLQRALSSALYVPNCLELCAPRNDGQTTNPQLVLYQGGSLEAAEWASQHQFAAATTQPIEKWFKPAVLDFASDSNPGGGWRGRQQGTQEEEICRLTSLGLSLERLSPFSIPSTGCVYVPDVAVVRNRSGAWLENPFWCATVAASLRSADNPEWILSKIRGVLAVATSNDHGVFVGGAWGCGAFGNDLELVAEAWRIAAKGISSDSLAMLVLALPSKTAFDAFCSVLPDAIVIGRET